MARKELEDAWKQSERLITKGRFDEALALLRRRILTPGVGRRPITGPCDST